MTRTKGPGETTALTCMYADRWEHCRCFRDLNKIALSVLEGAS